MSTFMQLTINGAGSGAVFALLALGFVIIYRASGAVNFAHGSLVLVAGYITVRAQESVGITVAAILGVLGAGVLAVIIERVLVARTRGGDPIALVLLTIGVDVVIVEEVARRLGSSAPFVRVPWANEVIHVGQITVLKGQIVALCFGLVIIAVLFALFRFTGWGLAMRAQAEHREAAALMGVRNTQVTAAAWLIAGVLAGIAVLFLATPDFAGGGVSRATHSLVLVAFPAAIIGGLDSTNGAVIGGFIVGLTGAYSQQYVSFEFARVAVYLVMLAVLVVRPSGLFGTKEVQRV